jgi:hypothetical protein
MEWFKKLDPDQMCIVIKELNQILNEKRNYSKMDIEIIEKVIIDAPIAKLTEGCKILAIYFSKKRCTLPKIKNNNIWYYFCTWRQIITNINLYYQKPHRGNLTTISKKMNIQLSQYQAGICWIYLKHIVDSCARNAAPWYTGNLILKISTTGS